MIKKKFLKKLNVVEKKKDKIMKEGVILEEGTYQKIAKLGEGSFGSVFLIYHLKKKKKMALKIVLANTDEEENLNRLVSELKIHYNCINPNIVKCLGYDLHNNKLKIALEFMDFGPLSRITKYKKNLHENFLGYIACNVIKALAYLQDKKILHRDIKPSNILLNYQGEVKIADFGESGELRETISYKNTLVGTLLYNSPERVTGLKYYANCDIWSVGVFIFECALGRYPLFPENCKPENLTFIGFEELLQNNKLPKLGDNYSKKFKNFVKKCLIKDPLQRPFARDLLKDPFIIKFTKVKSSQFEKILEITSRQLKLIKTN